MAKMSWFSRSQYQRSRCQRLAGSAVERKAIPEECACTPGTESQLCGSCRVGQPLAVVHLSTDLGLKDDAASAAWTDTSTPTPPAAAMLGEAKQRINELVAALPQDAGGLIRAVYFEELDLQEAGQRIGVSKSWASRLHAKTLHRLARGLQPVGQADEW